ncbi:uncharacterized protein AMSG_02783 [Thecamonas trahens ATCC 50062]|uniref:Uncharacterized protein n=1 Tax=Thecamonas trahens ATCC 50062 TaxID=461836 RepID=A0A0L0D2A4_THETB|nr:hypothetical protein AMSG_02783 [Thecamonas trahens ATCC 50062]KNC46331.1 hypothetical protein AMSG_02783 [Thecamonas trahens ATCC 50062]|eukprot:XP_013760624.1 hypothetical protein AMSG_02783 [Thecamonas trahens ATCC 50062]
MADNEPDLSKMTDEEKAFYQKYGKMPPKATEKFRRARGGKRIFDSADYSMQMAGVKGKIGGGGLLRKKMTLPAGAAASGANATTPTGDAGEDE